MCTIYNNHVLNVLYIGVYYHSLNANDSGNDTALKVANNVLQHHKRRSYAALKCA